MIHTCAVIGDAFPAVLAGVQRGDERSFDQLYRDSNPALVRYLRILDPRTADDVAAETWISVVRSIKRFAGDEPGWRSWLFTIARRRSVEETRRVMRRVPTVDLPEGHPDADGPPVRDTAEDALQNLDTRAALAAVAQLPRLQAEVVVLRVVAGLDVARVAEVVGRSPGAVRVAAHRGVQNLAKILAERGVTQ
jgi:RNA polymerase sigma-70 factor (ECF subfamily)